MVKWTRNQWLSSSALSRFLGLSTLGIVSLFGVKDAKAFQLYDGQQHGNNLEINLSTTLSWTPIWRTQNPSAVLLANPNGDDGDRALAHGMVSNLFEALPVLDVKNGNYGMHLSGEFYWNPTYTGTNQNHQGETLNYSVINANTFPRATVNVNGFNARLLDAFAYGTTHFGAGDQQTISMRVGRETVLWGQSLFLSNNGLAGLMAPFDVQTADNNPNAQTQQIIEPIGQVELTYQPNQIVTFQGYYKFQWQPDFLPGAGSYFNGSDLAVPGSSRLVAVPGAFYLPRIKDNTPSGTDGQFGISTQLTLGNYDVGFYALRADSYSPVVAVTSSNQYQVVYPRDIWAEAASVSTTVGAANVAGEVSFRQRMPLAQGTVIQLPDNNANSNPAYPIGNTWAAQASVIYLTPALPFDPGGITVDGEIGMNHVLAITANREAMAGYSGLHRSSTAAELQGTITPTYFNVLPNLQLAFPIGLHWNFYGRSMIDPTENSGTGNVNFGVQATYKVVWIASVTYNDYFGAANPNLAGEPSIADRNYVMLNIQRSF